MKYINTIREVLCQALLASQLARRGRWLDAAKFMGR